LASDTVNGATAGSAVTVHTSLAAAEAAAPATKAANISVAGSAFRNGTGGNQTMPARNGFGSVTSCAAWWEIVCPEGVVTHPTGLSPSTSHASSGPGYVVIRGTPSSADPRVNCILRSGTGGTAVLFGGMNRIKARDMRLEIGQTTLFNTTLANNWFTLENVDVRGKAGFEGTSNNIMPVGGTNNEFFSAFNVSQRNCAGQQFGFISRNETRVSFPPHLLPAEVRRRQLATVPDEFADEFRTKLEQGERQAYAIPTDTVFVAIHWRPCRQ
jgi:hypothetical protein